MKNKVPLLLVTAWVTMMSIVIHAIVRQSEFFLKSTSPIAIIENTGSGVVTRSEGLIRWKEAVYRQSLFDGDWVGTGPTATSIVDFGNGSKLKLGQDTLVQIRTFMRENEKKSYLIDLSRGALVTDVPKNCGQCASITIKSESNSYTVSSGESVGLFKEIGKDVKKLSSKAPIPIHNGPATPLMGVLGQEFSKSVATPINLDALKLALKELGQNQGAKATSPQTDAKVAVSRPTVFPSIKIDTQKEELVFSIDRPVSQFKQGLIYVPYNRVNSVSGNWKPALRIKKMAENKWTAVVSPSEKSNIQIEIDKFVSIAKEFQLGLVKEYRAIIQSGVVVFESKQSFESFKGPEITLILRSIVEEPKSPYFMGLDSIKPDQNYSNPWIKAVKLLKPQESPIQIQAYDGSDYVLLKSFVRGALGLSLFNGKSVAINNAAYVVRDKKIIADIGGANISADDIKNIAIALKADFVYRGNRESLHQKQDQGDLVAWITTSINQGKFIYVFGNGKTFPVRSDFVKKSKEMATFVEGQAKGIFTEKVEIIYSL